MVAESWSEYMARCRLDDSCDPFYGVVAMRQIRMAEYMSSVLAERERSEKEKVKD